MGGLYKMKQKTEATMQAIMQVYLEANVVQGGPKFAKDTMLIASETCLLGSAGIWQNGPKTNFGQIPNPIKRSNKRASFGRWITALSVGSRSSTPRSTPFEWARSMIEAAVSGNLTWVQRLQPFIAGVSLPSRQRFTFARNLLLSFFLVVVRSLKLQIYVMPRQ
ncbi:hypothetical protein B0H10DRAFT_2189099 [Mycena sp. CBHHK59/15]|nr:hypothetical protein B0H10DRAFT_2189099 [Mycena sp. CBHHK59/15]